MHHSSLLTDTVKTTMVLMCDHALDCVSPLSGPCWLAALNISLVVHCSYAFSQPASEWVSIYWGKKRETKRNTEEWNGE